VSLTQSNPAFSDGEEGGRSPSRRCRAVLRVPRSLWSRSLPMARSRCRCR